MHKKQIDPDSPPDPQPWDRLVSGLYLAIECLARLPQYVSCSSNNSGSSSIVIYEQILDFLLLDSRPGMPFIYLLHSLDGTLLVSSDLHGSLPSTQIAVALQPSFVHLLGSGFMVCYLHTSNPLILGLEERTWILLMRSFECCAMFLSCRSINIEYNVACQAAWVAAARALLMCFDFFRTESAVDHWQPSLDAPDYCRIVDICLECFSVPMHVCSNECISVAMDLIASVLIFCPCCHARVSLQMRLFRRFASLLSGSTLRATTSIKTSALRLLGICFEVGLQPSDFDDDLLKSRPNAPELHFSSAGHSFGGGPLLSLCGVDLAVIDTVIKSLHATTSFKLVPWLVAPLSPIVAVSQICRSVMMFGHGLKLLHVMRNFRSGIAEPSPLDSKEGVELLQKIVDCDEFAQRGETNVISSNPPSYTLSYLPKLDANPLLENTAILESSFWLHALTTALVHLKGMLTLFVSFSLNKELSYSDAHPIFNPKPQATLFPHFASVLDHPVAAPLVVVRNMPGTLDKSSHFVSNPLCVPAFISTSSADTGTATLYRIEPNSESFVSLNQVKNDLEPSIDVSAYNSFLSILQVLLNDRLKLIQDLLEEDTRSQTCGSSFFSNLTERSTGGTLSPKFLDVARCSKLIDSSRIHVSETDERQYLQLLSRFHMERLLFLADVLRLGLINGSDDTKDIKHSPKTISFVVRIATSLAAIPARQNTEIILRTASRTPLILPPLDDGVWPVAMALFFPCNSDKFEAMHNVIDHFADIFPGVCIELTGLSYKIMSIFLDQHPSFPISHVLSRLDVLPSAWRRQNFRALHFPRSFLDHFSRFLSASGYCSDPGSMQIKKERNIAIEHFISFFIIQRRSSGLSGIPAELLVHFSLNEAVIQSLCAQNFRPRLGKVYPIDSLEMRSSFGCTVQLLPFSRGAKCSFDDHSYGYLKQLLFRLNFQNSSLVTSLFVLDFIRSFYSATFRRSKFLSMGFSSFHSDHSRNALDIYHEYEPQHKFIQTVVNIVNSLSCVMLNHEISLSSVTLVGHEHAFVKKCFEFICFVVEDNFVVECVDPAALHPLQSQISVAKSRLQDMEFNAVKKRSSWDRSSFAPSRSPPPNQHALERVVLSSSLSRLPVVRMESVRFQTFKSAASTVHWKKNDTCFAKFEDKFYLAQVDCVELQGMKQQIQVSFTDYGDDKQKIQQKCVAEDLKAFVGSADVMFDRKCKREVPVASIVQIFNDKSECSLWNQDKNPFLQVLKNDSHENPFVFDNQDLLLLKAAFREDFRISGALDDKINGVYELCSFSGSAEYSKYRMNPALFGPQGSHYRSFPAYSGSQKPGFLDLPEMSYEPSQRSWVIQQGGKVLASLRALKPVELKHCLTLMHWEEKGLSSNIRAELLTNTSSPSLSSIRRSCLVRLIHKTNRFDQFMELYDSWKTSVNLVFESLSLYSKSNLFILSRDSTLPSFLGCFSAMISLLPRDRATMFCPPIQNICLILTQYLLGVDPDDPNNLLTSVQLSAIGMILSTFSLVSGHYFPHHHTVFFLCSGNLLI